MATVIINGQEIQIGDDERLNAIEAAARAGFEVPHYCWHPGLSVVASCRMCLIESGRRDPDTGAIEMLDKLVPGCQTPVADGSVFVTNSQKVIDARAMVEEDLLIRHPVDCPICDKAGECLLQDYHFQHGREGRRADIKPFTSRRQSLGDTVTLFVDRCIMCTRCVRFCREVSGTSELMVSQRGAHEQIDVFPGRPLDNQLAGNVVDLCPVGALGDKDFLYQQRVWFMNRHDGVCAGCSTGCSVHLEENQDRLYRLKPRENPYINKWWMCDEGRYGWKHVHSEKRLTQPQQQSAGRQTAVEWSDLPDVLDSAIREAGRLAAVLSPFLTVEEAYLLATYVRGIDPQALLVVGHVPMRGDDTEYPGGFTVRGEKCPNRRGVEQVVLGLSDQLMTWDEMLADPAVLGDLGALWITGGYKSDWNDEAAAAKLADLPLVIVQDLFPSPLGEQATIQLPAAAFAEREGSYVNRADRLQSFSWAIRPPAGVMVEGRLYWRLLGRSGLYDARQVMSEVAGEIAFFAAAMEKPPAVGVDLRVNQLT